MNKIYMIYFMLVLVVQIFAQGQGDPFNWTEPIEVEANDVFLLWLENDGMTTRSYQKVYRFKIDSTWLGADSLISKSPRHEDSRQGGSILTDVATGRFNKDPYDDVVAIWAGDNSGNPGIEIMIPEFDTTAAMWTNSGQTTLNLAPNNRIYVRTGDFDADSLDEFVVTNVTGDDSVHLYLFDVDSTLHPSLIDSICDEKIVGYDPFAYNNYFIEAGDFNGDGRDEILFQGVDGNTTSSAWGVYAKIYEFNGTSIEAKARRTIQTRFANYDIVGLNIAASAGNFVNDPKDEIAFLCILRLSNSPFNIENRSYLYLLEVSSDLQQINFDPGKREYVFLGDYGQFPNYLGLASGDLNNDGRDEVVFTTNESFSGSNDKIFTYATDDNLNLTRKADINVAEEDFDFLCNNLLEIKDVNMDDREDIIVVKNFVNNQFADGFFCAMVSMNDDLTQSYLVGRMLGDEPQHDNAHPFGFAVGNFDGYNFSIGQPKHYTQNDVVQPIVILNAPPVHFDMFNGNPFDISGCFNGGSCDFVATYRKQNTTSVEVSTKVHKDWAISAGVAASGSVVAAPLGAGAQINYEAHLLYKHGRHFSNDTTNIQTIIIEEVIQARVDDRVFTTITDYDLWEYPVYHGNEKFPRRSILTAVPNNSTGIWFPSKSYNAVNYIPDHEVSNILSYQAYDTLGNNPNAAQTIKANYVGNSYVVDPTSPNQTWFLSFSDFTSNQADTVRENGVDIGVNFLAVFDFDFTKKTMTTHTTSVTDLIDVNVQLGSLNPGIGGSEYTITPYAYWAENDALVVDYAVKPSIAPPGFPLTWWQQQYGNNSDPTFILPWRLDPEKGFPLTEPAKRYQTKDIIFSPATPLPGDTVRITARVRNFSLIPTPLPVSVKFYLNDPDSGGTPIIGINGTNSVSTIGPIPERGRSDVSFLWILPNGFPSFPRIYAVLDQEDAIPEVHSNNNKGFNVLGSSTITNIEEITDPLIHEYVLFPSYPNPFNPTTTISFSLATREKVRLEIFNSLGQRVKTLLSRDMPAGKHSVIWDARNDSGIPLGSGIYFYRISSASFIETRKMLLLK